ncbi:hypothetical protein [Xanthomonas albilineans]|uniref:hypothetical protein n=1 Tax=Xanthomonas albilineans TaxID=29447 RepID=UPI000A6B5C16|nr:hypothetical protein [Xanthomonas albilineans]
MAKALLLEFQLTSSDFCIDADGQIYFLDLNPGGAFLFVEYNNGDPITSKLSSLIGGGKVADYPGLHQYNANCSDELKVLNV